MKPYQNKIRTKLDMKSDRQRSCQTRQWFIREGSRVKGTKEGISNQLLTSPFQTIV